MQATKEPTIASTTITAITYVKLILTWNPTDNLPQYPPQVIVESLIGGGEGEEHKETFSNQTTS